MRLPKSDPYIQRQWQPHEKPTLLGSPSTPIHPPGRRIAYGLVGLLVCLTGALGNALVTANLNNLQGTFAAWSNEIAWLPAVYVMTNASINLLLVKFRQQYGLRAFTEGFLVLYVLVTFFHLFVNDLNSAIMVRAAHGMVSAALSSLGIYYQVQAWAGEASSQGVNHRRYRFSPRHSCGAPVLLRASAAQRMARALFLRAGARSCFPRLRAGVKTAAERS